MALSACVSTPQSDTLLQQGPAAFSQPVVLPGIAFFPQERYQCGPAALATMLQSSGVDAVPSALVPLIYVPGREGSFQVELVAAARSRGRLAYRIPPTLTALFAEINAGYPVLVMQNLGVSWYPRWHFAVVKGYDLKRREVLLNSGTHEDYAHPLRIFERTWARSEHWAIVVLQPGQVPANGEPGPYFTAVVAFARTSDPAASRHAWVSGLNAWPDDRNLMMGYANFLYQQGDYAAARKWFRNVVDAHPEYAPAYNNLGQVLFEQGYEDKGLAYVNAAITLGGDFIADYRATLNELDARRIHAPEM